MSYACDTDTGGRRGDGPGIGTGNGSLVEVPLKSVPSFSLQSVVRLTGFLICHLSVASVSVPAPVVNLFLLIRGFSFVISY